MTIATEPPIDGRRYQAARAAVRARCRSLGLCPNAAAQCIERAARLVRQHYSAGEAARQGVQLANRMATIKANRSPAR